MASWVTVSEEREESARDPAAERLPDNRRPPAPSVLAALLNFLNHPRRRREGQRSLLPSSSSLRTQHSNLDPTTTEQSQMPYIMNLYVDGGCRNNGAPNAFGAAAAAHKNKWGRFRSWTRSLPRGTTPTPTSQRAELTAIILALEKALARYKGLHSSP
ncbi:uncharacterized protein DSM5745_03958 [Aspergillus mulundensis]|uniref:RNase H type-1 domain-containing protein n=1 Tax=Aspergillus mulundensis TaxID=1810919 RepID=A0A3D8SB92_9EURO|nr:hypothetical protein DSM5745_03958 [Aspergillus mulundensis]RDW83632.1 hypothetical protein DSM5745_03958 [Aspergillus mulundensis]